MGPSQTSVVEFTSISKRFGAVAALTEVSFSCEPRTVHGIVGENGVGKSTLVKILNGLARLARQGERLSACPGYIDTFRPNPAPRRSQNRRRVAGPPRGIPHSALPPGVRIRQWQPAGSVKNEPVRIQS